MLWDRADIKEAEVHFKYSWNNTWARLDNT